METLHSAIGVTGEIYESNKGYGGEESTSTAASGGSCTFANVVEGKRSETETEGRMGNSEEAFNMVTIEKSEKGKEKIMAPIRLFLNGKSWWRWWMKGLLI